MLKDNLVFFKEFLAEFESTGSCFPTSKWAVNALTHPIRSPRIAMTGKRILEVGPGTGSVTTQILQDMTDHDELVICEINPRFMKSLQEKLADNPDFIRHRARISFFLGPIQSLVDARKFDLIICSLPFLNFTRQIVEEIFIKFKELAHEKTLMTYYEFIGMRSLGKAVSPERKKRFLEIEDFFDSAYYSRHETKKRVWLNFLPVDIYTIQPSAWNTHSLIAACV